MTTALTKPGLAAVTSPFNLPIGHTSFGPVYLVTGGRGGNVDFLVGDDEGDDPRFDDEDDEDEDEDEDDEDDDQDAGYDEQGDDDQDDGYQGNPKRRALDDDWVPPDRKQWEKVEAALKRANSEAAHRRILGKQLEKLGIKPGDDLDDFLRTHGIDPDTGNKIEEPGDAGKPDDAERKAAQAQALTAAERRGAVKAEARYRPAVVKLAAKDALREAGWQGQNLEMALRFVDPHSLEVRWDDASGDATVVGLDDQITAIQEEFPDWFRPSRTAAGGQRAAAGNGARRVDGGNRRKPEPKPKNWAEQIERRLMRR